MDSHPRRAAGSAANRFEKIALDGMRRVSWQGRA
jgi:hypothetical protein